MAIIINSKFRPFSYAEVLNMVSPAAQAQKQSEDELATIDTMSSVWEKLKDSDIDKDVYNQYRNFQDNLQTAIDDLYTKGYNTSTNRALGRMKARYAKEITPIEEAYKKREEEHKLQQQAYINSGGKVLYTRHARDTKLSDYMNDRVQDYSMLNLDSLMNEGMVAGKAISSRYFRTSEGQRFKGDYLALVKTQGLNPTEAMEVLQNSDKYPEFQKFVQDTQNKYQIGDNSAYSSIDTSMANNALMQGINMGIVYNEAETNPHNWRAELVAKEASELKVARAKYNMEHPQPTGDGDVFTRHWEGVLGEGDFDAVMLDNLMAKLTMNGKGLSKNYSGGKGGFNNPMKIYEEIRKYAKKHPTAKNEDINRFTAGYEHSRGAKAGGRVDVSYENAVKVIKEKYGVSEVLSEKEYNALKSLGYTSSSSFNDMNGTHIYDSINKRKQLSRASSVNMSDISHPAASIAANMRGKGKDIYDIDKKEKIEYKENDKIDILDIAYSKNHKGKILILTADGRRQAVPASYYSAEAKKIVDKYDRYIEESVTDEQKAYWQDAASNKLENLFNAYNKIRSNTDSHK